MKIGNLVAVLNDDYAGDAETKTTLNFLSQAVAKNTYITVIKHAYVAGYYADHFLPIITQNGMIRLRAKAVIVATGAFEQPPVFRNNDLPGVMLGTAAQRLMHRYRVAPFNHGVVFTANSQGYRVALDLLAAGVTVEALIDLRAQSNEPLAEKVAGNNIAIYRGYCVYEVTPSANQLGVKAARICKYDEATATPDTTTCISIPCDGIAMSAGWSPAAALLYQAGTKMRFDDDLQQFFPKTLPAGIFAAGKVNGVFDQTQRGLDGERAASEALQYLNQPADHIQVQAHQGDAPSHPYPMVPHEKGKNFIDFDEDIQLKDFLNAAQEGFDNIELMKRFTTFGMGPSQGKHANMNAIRVLARIRQLPVEKVGSTTARPFYHPTTLASLAGHHFTPYRHTALHQWHAQAGAVFTQVGNWMRPAYYQKNAETEQVAVECEIFAVRNHAGLIDVSTLGKIEVHGPDAALLLDRFYTGRFADQAVGTTRYAVAVDETGVLLDDGVVARLAEDSFYLTTTTSNSALIYREMLRWIAIWQLDATLINVTSSVAAINLAGKQAKVVLAKLVGQAALVNGMHVGRVGQFTFDGIPVHVMGVKFVSHIAYELHLPSSKALELWEALITKGESVGIQAVGIAAQRVLRLEMGHPIIGHDTDGLTNPFEAGLSFALDKQKAFFIGQRSLSIIAKKPLDKKLVCFTLTANAAKQLPQECNLVISNNEIAGRVTSIAFSPTVEKTIGMAYVLPNQSDIGAVFNIRTDDGTMCEATVSKPPFINGAGAHA